MPSRWITLLALSIASLVGGLAPTTSQAQKLEAAYVILGAQAPVARVVITGATQCPTITIDNTPQPMSIRAEADADFPVLVCEARVPNRAASASVEGQALPLPNGTPDAIVAFGDTGCRLKGIDTFLRGADDREDAGKFQDCDDPSRWPFAQLSTTIAGAKPALVIHVGDYLYRESRCPATEAGCQGSPHGDNWPTWKADFFAPAEPLLRAAPWIVTRGNHESCERAGKGYFRLLNPALAGQTPPRCTDLIPHYTVAAGARRFIVMDTSSAEDQCSPRTCDNAKYTAEFASMEAEPGTWLISHRPVWGFNQAWGTITDALQQALQARRGTLPEGIELVLSGHIHLWEVLSFADQRPPQFVLGNGGTLLSEPLTVQFTGQQIGGLEVKRGRSYHGWGYTRFAPGDTGGGWTATVYDFTGGLLFSCRVKAADVDCR